MTQDLFARQTAVLNKDSAAAVYSYRDRYSATDTLVECGLLKLRS